MIIRPADVAHLHTTVRPTNRPTRRQVEAMRALIDLAIAEYEAAWTINLRHYAAKHSITLDDDGGSSGSHACDL